MDFKIKAILRWQMAEILMFFGRISQKKIYTKKRTWRPRCGWGASATTKYLAQSLQYRYFSTEQLAGLHKHLIGNVVLSDELPYDSTFDWASECWTTTSSAMLCHDKTGKCWNETRIEHQIIATRP